MMGSNKGRFIYECPYCGEKCISLWQKHHALYSGNECRCEKCGVILKYEHKVYYINALVTILIVILYFYIQSRRESGTFSLFMANFIIIIQATFYFIYMWFAKMTYLPDGKHPEYVFRRKIQTIYDEIEVFVEKSIYYENDYIVRIRSGDVQRDFKYPKASFSTVNAIDAVYNSKEKMVFRVFDKYVSVKKDGMVLSDFFHRSYKG